MKATHIKWEPMWEKYFSNYNGLMPPKKCSDSDCPEKASVLPETKEVEDTEKYHASYFLSNPPLAAQDRFYPIDNDEYLGYSISEVENLPAGTQSSMPHAEPERVIVVDEAKPVLHEEKNNQTVREEQKKATESIVQKGNKDKPVIKSRSVGRQPKEIIFECESGQGFSFVTPDREAMTYTPFKPCIAKTLGIISIDTTCLKRPKTKVMFSCNIDYMPRCSEAAAQLEFVLSRSCNNGEESPIGNWVYDIERNDRLAQCFKFNFCNCSSFPGCYNYFVRVVPVFLKNCALCITNCHMDAYAQAL